MFSVIAASFIQAFSYGSRQCSVPMLWNVAYSILVFHIPSFTSYVIVAFAHFRQDNESIPWKALKRFFSISSAHVISTCDERTDWEFHSSHCIHRQQLKRVWSLVKIAVSASVWPSSVYYRPAVELARLELRSRLSAGSKLTTSQKTMTKIMAWLSYDRRLSVV